MRELTEKQRAVYDFIVAYQADKGFPPTRIEIAEHFGLASPNGVQQHLLFIEKKGYIKLLPGKVARGIVVNHKIGEENACTTQELVA